MATFDVTWTNSDKPAGGKVFARKRITKKPAENTEKVKLIKSDNTTNSTVSKPKNETKSFTPNTASSNNNNPSKVQDSSRTFVKRKHKKDKTAVASAEADNDQATNDNSTTKSIQNKTHSLYSEKYKTVYVNTNTKGKSVVEKVFSEGKKFSDLNIHKHLVSNLEKHNFKTLTKVQEKSIPVLLTGKNVLIRSQTGSGKTLAYAIPILNSLLSMTPRLQRNDGVQAIIVVPTRELALQTHDILGKVNTFQWIITGHLCGGENRKTEKDRFRKGVHILIGTPGRLLDHILHTAAFKLDNVKCVVLDEADRLLDMGFKKDIERLVEEIDRSKTNAEYNPLAILRSRNANNEEKSDLNDDTTNSDKTRQTLLLSATLTKGIAELADFIMKDHTYIDALDESETTNPDHMIIPSTVKQSFILTYVKHRLFTLSGLLIAQSQKPCKIFVFMATSQMVDYHYELFTKYLLKMPKNRGKLKSGDVVLLDDVLDSSDDEDEMVMDVQLYKLHGNMDQSKRKEVFSGFKAGKKGILICTDVAARGLDIPEATCIIQYTGPQSDEDYLHRVGRTGRAGKSGSSFIFLTHEEQEYITRLQQHKVFLHEQKPEEFLKHLCLLMEEPDEEKASVALQKRFEDALKKDKDLHKMACFAYSSWSRFYNTYPATLRGVFDFKKVNLGHYVTSFGLKETPTAISKIIHQKVAKVEPRRLNQKLSNHPEQKKQQKFPQKRKIKSVSLTTSEYSSGMQPKKRKKNNKQ